MSGSTPGPGFTTGLGFAVVLGTVVVFFGVVLVVTGAELTTAEDDGALEAGLLTTGVVDGVDVA